MMQGPDVLPALPTTVPEATASERINHPMFNLKPENDEVNFNDVMERLRLGPEEFERRDIDELCQTITDAIRVNSLIPLCCPS